MTVYLDQTYQPCLHYLTNNPLHAWLYICSNYVACIESTIRNNGLCNYTLQVELKGQNSHNWFDKEQKFLNFETNSIVQLNHIPHLWLINGYMCTLGHVLHNHCRLSLDKNSVQISQSYNQVLHYLYIMFCVWNVCIF